MSAKSINQPGKKLTIEDEIETFFHVLLYYAVRFLPHNLHRDCIPIFLEHYFDSFCTLNDQYRCGFIKVVAMVTGDISIGQYSSSFDSLKFVQRDNANQLHVLDGLLADLLRSLKEVHSPPSATIPCQEPSKVESCEDVDAFWAELEAMPNVDTRHLFASSKPTEGARKSEPGVSTTSSRRTRPRKTANSLHASRSRSKSSKIRAKTISLKEHRPVIKLFQQYLRRKDWPTDDRRRMLPAKGEMAEETDEEEASNDECSSKKRQLDKLQPEMSKRVRRG